MHNPEVATLLWSFIRQGKQRKLYCLAGPESNGSQRLVVPNDSRHQLLTKTETTKSSIRVARNTYRSGTVDSGTADRGLDALMADNIRTLKNYTSKLGPHSGVTQDLQGSPSSSPLPPQERPRLFACVAGFEGRVISCAHF